MHRKSPQWLDDIEVACGDVIGWTAGLSLADYEADDLMRSAVERNFEIVGEALRRLERTDPTTAARIGGYRKLIDFRNVLAHGYEIVLHGLVWGYIQAELPPLRARVGELQREAGE